MRDRPLYPIFPIKESFFLLAIQRSKNRDCDANFFKYCDNFEANLSASIAPAGASIAPCEWHSPEQTSPSNNF
jgi:hypothetical protein